MRHLMLLAAVAALSVTALAAIAQPLTPTPLANTYLQPPMGKRELAQSQSAPTQPQQTRIQDLRRTNDLVITGQVVSIVGNNFTLDDGSGQIIVDAGPRWYREINLNQGEQVTVVGELSDRSDEFDAFSIQRADGSVIEIRPAEGPPPWAGGSRGKGQQR
jgi:uncharacterized protein YdeI (BOF family)